MVKRPIHRCFLALGLLAMLGALVSVPFKSTYAFAMGGKSSMAASASSEMPCHKPAKHCPDCPQKICPDLGSCFVKCFQPLSPPVGQIALHRKSSGERVGTERADITAGSLVHPLLRPPSV